MVTLPFRLAEAMVASSSTRMFDPTGAQARSPATGATPCCQLAAVAKEPSSGPTHTFVQPALGSHEDSSITAANPNTNDNKTVRPRRNDTPSLPVPLQQPP